MKGTADKSRPVQRRPDAQTHLARKLAARYF
jgi:hypothetical protein